MQSQNEKLLERGAAFLQDPKIMNRLSEQTRKDIQEGKKEFFLSDFYVRKKLDGFAGEIELIRVVDSAAIGITRFDKGVPIPHADIAVVAIGLAYAYDATDLLVADQVRYASSEYLNTFPTKLVNADLVVKNGQHLIIESRVKQFLANAYADFGVGANDENNVLLPTPKLLQARKTTTANLKFPVNGAAPAHSHFVEVTFKGVYIADRA